MVTILVCGSRNWTDYKTIFDFLNGLQCEYKPNQITIVEGDCKGADKAAGSIAVYLRYNKVRVPADWQQNGKAAGPIRNQEMLDKYKPSMVVAFHNDYENSKGTKDMCERAKAANIYTVLVTSDGLKTLHSKQFTIGEAFTKEYLDKNHVSEEERNQPFPF